MLLYAITNARIEEGRIAKVFCEIKYFILFFWGPFNLMRNYKNILYILIPFFENMQVCLALLNGEQVFNDL